MTPLWVGAGLTGWAGVTLLLSRRPWFAQGSLTERVRPHVRAHRGVRRPDGVLSVAAMRTFLGPLATTVGAALSRALGVGDELAAQLRRLEEDAAVTDVADVRLRQLGLSIAAAGIGAMTVAPLAPPPLVALGAPLVAGAGAFIGIEHRRVSRSVAVQRRLRLELPIVIEQLGTLLSAGSSLPGAIAHLGTRSRGVAAGGFRTVTRRASQGVDEVTALREWAEVMAVPALDRLVRVLALHREARDLGALIANEARTTRAEVHRELIEELDRRAQAVWIPVTVATLLPGVIFMAVPFVDALRQLGAT